MHNFNYKWNIKDGYPQGIGIKNDLKVFGTFINGGGSTMGYKLSGFTHLGGVEIDPQVADIYKTNHNPKYLYVQDIREFNKREDLPKELYELDILDGSPPCSTFSMAGSRESAWGKEKVFREGQAKQTLDDLVFVYIETINKLKPKVAILENVKGMIAGNAKAYVKEANRRLNEYGYDVQIFLLNAASMGVPQRRERVFFVCSRKELKYPKLKLDFNERAIAFREIIDKSIIEENISEYQKKLWNKKTKKDKSFGDLIKRLENRTSMFSNPIWHSDSVCNTVTSSGDICLYDIARKPVKNEICSVGSYPQDYNFKTIQPQYLIGMSVPPVMMAQIANQIYLQWFKK